MSLTECYNNYNKLFIITQVYKDAAQSVNIEVDDQGCLASVMMTDDINDIDLRFGRQNIIFQPEIDLLEGERIQFM